MNNFTNARKLRLESLEERLLLAVMAGGGLPEFAQVSECSVANDEFIPIDLTDIALPKTTEECSFKTQLSAPTILTGTDTVYVSYGVNNHRIAWDEIDNVSGYELGYSVDGTGWVSVETNENFVIVPDLTYGSDVTYRVRALGTGSYTDSDWSTTKTFNVCPMDIDGDNFIGPGDYALLSSAWFSMDKGTNWNPCFDIDGDGFVGPGDYAYLSTNWLNDVHDEGLSFPAVNKISLTVPDSALTVQSILKDSDILTVRVNIDASLISGIEAGDDVKVSAIGIYENAENDTDENVSKDVTVVFSISGEDAYKYNSIPSTTVTGTVYPYTSITLSVDSSKLSWGNNRSIVSGNNNVDVSFEPGAITGFINNDDTNADVIITAKAVYANNINTGDSDIISAVEIQFTISGPKANGYKINNISALTGTVTGTPIVWYTGIIPLVYATGSARVENPYANDMDTLPMSGDSEGKDIQTIINSLTADIESIGTKSNTSTNAESHNNDSDIVYDFNSTDWDTACELTNAEMPTYQGYRFVITNQNCSFEVWNGGEMDDCFDREISIVRNGVTYTGWICTSSGVASGMTGDYVVLK